MTAKRLLPRVDRRRLFFAVAAILLISALICTHSYIIFHAEHECEGEHCEICEHIFQCLHCTSRTELVSVVYVFLVLLAYGLLREIYNKDKIYIYSNPVTLKDRFIS